jgi:hypothetical protein
LGAVALVAFVALTGFAVFLAAPLGAFFAAPLGAFLVVLAADLLAVL